MKKIAALIITLLVVIYSTSSPEKIIDIAIINSKQVILFKKNCKFESIYITTESGKDISQAIFSNIPGEGVYFKENTYVEFEKLLKFTPENNKIYELSSITECGKYPIYRKFLKFKINNGRIEVIAFN